MAKLIYMNAFTAKVEADAVIPDGMSAETFAATTKAAAEGDGYSVADELLAIIAGNQPRPDCFLVVSDE